MAPKYEKGQKVIITPTENNNLSARDSTLKQHAGKIGKVVDYYWITLRTGARVYIYTIQLDDKGEEAVLHEDELASLIE